MSRTATKGPLIPCPTGGQCSKLYFEKHGWPTAHHTWGYGVKKAFKNEPVFSEKLYRCCTHSDCHLPINGNEADMINRWLGVSAKEIVVEIDDDFLNALEKAFDG